MLHALFRVFVESIKQKNNLWLIYIQLNFIYYNDGQYYQYY